MSSSGFAALCSAFGKYDVVHIHAEGPAFFAWLPKLLGKRVVVTIHGIDWQREKWQSGLGSKFIHQGEKNAAKYADEVIVLSKGVQDYFKETYGRECICCLARLADNDYKCFLIERHFTIAELRCKFHTHRNIRYIFQHILSSHAHMPCRARA